jgi:hypothetical protein
VEEAGQKFFIGYAIGGGCSIVGSSINLNELKKKLLNIYKLQFIKIDDEGMQITEFYRFDSGSSYANDYLYKREWQKKFGFCWLFT